MLDVCFSDSMKGALCYAQKCGNIRDRASAITVINQDKTGWWQHRKDIKKAQAERRVLEKQAIPLGGSPEDVIGLSFDFSYGDIAAPLEQEVCPRKQAINQRLTANPWGEPEEMNNSVELFWKNCLTDLEKLQERALKGETVRIWADETLCVASGLLFTADMLKDSDCKIILVPLPPQYKNPVKYQSWLEVKPELFGRYLGNAFELTKERILDMAKQWQRLMYENAPLRVVEGTSVISADEDYYDDIIRQEYPKDTCRIAELIGNVLGRQRPGISDWLIAQRIRVLISNNELKVFKEDPVSFYNTAITCVK